LIARHLNKRGYPVVLGQQWEIGQNLKLAAPRGVVLFRTANQVQAREMGEIARAGQIVVGMDEEALPFAGDGSLDNVDPDALAAAELFCAQSEDHAAVLRKRFPQAAVKVTGNPRLELLRSNKHRPERGPFVLFNTSLALTNSLWGDEKAAVTRMVTSQPMPVEEVTARLLFERAAMEQTLSLIRWLAPQYPVVVRPHPAENPDAWRAIPGIKVVVGSNPIPWMLGATVTLHNNSTTGLEAAVLGLP
jgi:surface carbohydrate biosynthesis protein